MGRDTDIVKKFQVITFFYGNPLLVKEPVQKKAAAFLKRHPQGLVQSLDLNESGQLEGVSEELQAQTFFGEKTILIINGAFDIDCLPLLKQYEQNPSPDIELIFQAGDAPEKTDKKFFEFLSKRAETVQFGEIKGTKLQKWITEKFKEAGLSVSVQALDKLMAVGAASSQKLEQEVAKIIAYKSYQGPSSNEASKLVKGEEIEKLVQSDAILNNFALADAIANQDRRKGLELLHVHLAEGEDPYAILGLLVYQFRNLLKIKSLVKKPVAYAELVGLTKLHPYVVKKSYEQARKFELEDLVKIYRRLFELEVGTKDGKFDLSLALFSLVLEI